MNTTFNTNHIRRSITAAVVAIVASIALGGTAVGAQNDPPPWTQCVYRNLPIAVDLGGILPVNYVPPIETQRALLGEIKVGTDCSIYDLPV